MLSQIQFNNQLQQQQQNVQNFNISNSSSSTSSSGASSPTSSNNSPIDISTIFIIGFPDDFKERELTNMFLFAPGFEGAVLKTTCISTCPAYFQSATTTTNSSNSNSNSVTEDPQRKQLIGFVKFSKPAEALYALEILNGRILDLERGLVLKAEIAKKNFYIKPSSVGIGVTGTGKRFSTNNSDEESSTTTTTTTSTSTCNCILNFTCSTCAPASIPIRSNSTINSNRVMNIMLPGQSDPAPISAPLEDCLSALTLEAPIPHPKSPYLSSLSSSPASPVLLSKVPAQASEKIVDISSLQRSLIASPNLGSMAAIVGENFPCNTLYVGNLPPSTQEDELRALFRNCLGYRRLSFRPKSNGPMCFVEFEDIACATTAMETLYGTMISCSSPLKGGIRLSFSKNPLGLRVASPVNPAIPSNPSPSFMEAIGAETDNPDHRNAISTIFAHYFKINPHKGIEIFNNRQ